MNKKTILISVLSFTLILTSFSTDYASKLSKFRFIEKGKGSHKLTILRFYCKSQEDYTGCDDIYFVVDGDRTPEEWRGCRGTSREVNKTFYFGESVTVKMYDRDIDSPDDLLGTKTIYGAEAGDGERTKSFTESGANYTLYYRVD